jgi:hypothetical protein
MRTLIATLVIVTAGVTATWAQPGYGPYGGGGYGGYGGYGGWGGGGFGANWGAGSTAAGSAAVGMGDLVRSQGMYNQMTAQAAISLEQARTLDLDNKLKSTQTYFEMRRINQEARLAEAQRNRAEAADNRYTTKVIAKKPTLTVTQLDPVTGVIRWPAPLMQDSFAADRAAVQEVFTRRAEHRIGTSAYLELQPVIGRMQQSLNEQVKVLPPQDFVDARRFMNTLLEEARSADTSLASAAH